jgi:hypothetical protein
MDRRLEECASNPGLETRFDGDYLRCREPSGWVADGHLMDTPHCNRLHREATNCGKPRGASDENVH